MSLVGTYNSETKKLDPLKINIDPNSKRITDEVSSYNPTPEEKAALDLVSKHFQIGYLNMYTPRVELNDLAVIQRAMVDQMAFNTYQPNNGESYQGDQSNGWRSQAIRPIVRNKCISIAAHALARLLFPKVFAWNDLSESQKDAAEVMSDLIEVAAEESNYKMTALTAVLSALVNPYSIVYKEYAEVIRRVKGDKQENGDYEVKEIIDDIYSGFKDTVVSPDEFYFENFYEPNVQKQVFVIWRRARSHETLAGIYGNLPNWKYVREGMQTIYNDANQSFYYVYDPNLRQYMNEEVIYWNRASDLKLIVVNGILLTDPNNPNPRMDKQYPFVKFGYELINNRCFCYKSLAFKVSHDANIINTLYPMIIDGTYLNLYPPFKLTGEDIIGSDVIFPGRVTTLSSPNSQLDPIKVANDVKSGMDTLFQVEQSVNESSESPAVPTDKTNITAYQISVAEKEKNVILGLFVNMISDFVEQYGNLTIPDILQYMTIADAVQITDNPELVYKTFLLHNKKIEGKNKTKRIMFDSTLPSKATEEERLTLSYDTLRRQGGPESDEVLARVSPDLFRNLHFMCVVSADVINPMSEEVERQYNLEVYDRAINNPVADQESIFELLLESTPTTQKDPKKFIQKQEMMQPNPMATGGVMNSNSPAQPVQLPQLQPNLMK